MSSHVPVYRRLLRMRCVKRVRCYMDVRFKYYSTVTGVWHRTKRFRLQELWMTPTSDSAAACGGNRTRYSVRSGTPKVASLHRENVLRNPKRRKRNRCIRPDSELCRCPPPPSAHAIFGRGGETLGWIVSKTRTSVRPGRAHVSHTARYSARERISSPCPEPRRRFAAAFRSRTSAVPS